MDLNQASILARELMDYHNLQDWSFKFDTATVRFGCCWYRERKISLSRKLTLINHEDEVRDVILHEIAHALAPESSNHDDIWKNIALSIGCRGNIYHTGKIAEKKYIVSCNYGHQFQSNKKLKKTIYSCAECSPKFNKKYLLNYKLNPRYRI